MRTVTKIGGIGDFRAENPTHLATNSGIQHAAEALGAELETVWLPTDEAHDFGAFDGLFCSPGSPYRSLEGALEGIRYARENGVPFLGTCGGSQHLVLEYARNVMVIEDAEHAESNPYAPRLFITPLSRSLVGQTMEVWLKSRTRAAAVYGADRATERYYCNFGLNPAYQEGLQEAGLVVSGTDADGEARILELPGHPFYVGTLFVPQARSERGRPHPMVLEFCRAGLARVSKPMSQNPCLKTHVSKSMSQNPCLKIETWGTLKLRGRRVAGARV
jgi:CTP synthase (UTP-ammonia lyase)